MHEDDAGADEWQEGCAVEPSPVRVAKAVNRALGRRGRFWADRCHAWLLQTPRDVRIALSTFSPTSVSTCGQSLESIPARRDVVRGLAPVDPVVRRVATSR